MENFNPKTSNNISDEHNIIASIIGFGFNIVLAILIIHFFLTPQIYLQAPINVTVLGLGLIGAFIPLVIVSVGIKLGKISFPVNKNTEGLLQLVHKPFGPILISLGAGISEELLFRGAIFEILSLYLNPISSTIIISILFFIVHLPQYKNSFFLNLVMFILSVIFTMIYIITDSIWTPVIAHSIYNFVICIWLKSGKIKIQ